jgi:hypothetical protein
MSNHSEHNTPTATLPLRAISLAEAALRKALALAAEGFPVIQLYSIGPDGECNCSPWHKEHGKCKPGKHPACKHGYNDATTDPRRIKRWFRYPRNIGIATGPTHLIALDPDTRNGGDIVLASLIAELGPLPPSRAFQSGSGDVRYLYRLPADIHVKSGQVSRPNGDEGVHTLDVIANTGGLVAWGTHPTGRPYIDLGGPLAEMPWWWARRLAEETSSFSLSHSVHALEPIGSSAGHTQKVNEVARTAAPMPEQLHTARWLWEEHLRPGVPFPAIGERVRCLFHDDGRSMDSGFVVTTAGYVVFHCFHESKSYTLQDLHALLVLKADAPTEVKALAKMRDELYLASGAIERPKVRYEPLPPYGLSKNVHQVYADVISRLEHNWVSNPGKPVMYTASYGALRLGLHKQLVKEALITLQKIGALVKVGQTPMGGHMANLWLTSLEAGSPMERWWEEDDAFGLSEEKAA